MLFHMNPSADRPLYAQIGDQVKAAVLAGLLRPGEMVPSVRELARQLVINPNTVARAYRDLQGEGVLEPVRGTGLVVAVQARDACHRDRRTFVRERVRTLLVEIRRAGLSDAEVWTLLGAEWAALVGSPRADQNGVGSESNNVSKGEDA